MLLEIERLDDEWFVRSAASSALESVHKRQQPHAWQPVRAADQPWLENIALRSGQKVPDGRAAVAFVLKVLAEATDAPLKVAAVQLLVQMPAQEALPTLKQLSENEAEETAVREAAYFAYQSLGQVYES
jgi:HEAT repeat protein